MGRDSGLSNEIKLKEPKNSSGVWVSDHIKSDAKPIFRNVVFPSSYFKPQLVQVDFTYVVST